MSVNFTLPETPENRKPSVFAASFMFLFAMMGLTIAPFLAYPVNYLLVHLVPGFGETAQGYVMHTVYYACFILIPVYFYAKSRPACAERMRINPLKEKLVLWVVLAAVVSASAMNYVTSLWLILIEAIGGRMTETALSMPDSASGLAAMIMFSAVLPGMAEEVLFRGVLLGAWEERGTAKAMAVSGLFFAMMHGSIEGFPAEFLSGLILAFLVVSTSSLFAGMIYHTVHNALCLILSYTQSGDASGASVPLIQAVGGGRGVAAIFIFAAASMYLLYAILQRIDRQRIREKRPFGVRPMPRREIGASETVVIASCVIVGGFMYLVNLLEIAGILG